MATADITSILTNYVITAILGYQLDWLFGSLLPMRVDVDVLMLPLLCGQSLLKTTVQVEGVDITELGRVLVK